MTNSEAIELLSALTFQYRNNDRQYCQLDKIDGYDFDALNLAIKALKKNTKLRKENEHIRQTYVSHEVYIDLLKEYVDVLEENEKLKNKYNNLDAKFTNMMTNYENKITKIKIEIARLKEKEVAKKPIRLNPPHKMLRCPVCKCEVELNELELHYCDNCGQHIDWSE
jgi:predicted nuclease with TOPRIM domain